MNRIIQIVILSTFIFILGGCSTPLNIFESDINPETGAPYTKEDIFLYSEKGDYETVKKLVRLGFNVDMEYLGDTPLYYAIKSNNLKTVKVLVEGGANLDWQNGPNKNALLVAANEASYNVIPYLLDKGADIYYEDANGRNIIEYIFKSYRGSIYHSYGDFIKNEDLLKTLNILVDYDAGILNMQIQLNEDSSTLYSPIMFAINNFDPMFTKAMFSLGFTIDLYVDGDLEIINLIQPAINSASSQSAQLIACIISEHSNVPKDILYGNAHNSNYFSPYCKSNLEEFYKDYQINENRTADMEESLQEETQVEEQGEHFIASNQMRELLHNHSFLDKDILITDDYQSAVLKAGTSNEEGNYSGGWCSFYSDFIICIDKASPDKLSGVELFINYPLKVKELEIAINQKVDITNNVEIADDSYSSYLNIGGQEYIISFDGSSSDSLIKEIFIKNS